MLKIQNYNLEILFKIFLFIWVIFIPMKTSFYPMSYVLMMLIFFIHIFRKKRIGKFKDVLFEQKNILIAFSFIILSMTISNILSPLASFLSWSIEFNYVFRYLFLFLIFLFLYKENFFTKRFLLIAIFSSLFLQGFDGIFQAIFHYDFIKGNESSLLSGLSGATFNRNTFGMFMAIGSSLSLGILFKKDILQLKKTEILILSLFFIIFIFNLLFSYSRASWLFFAMFMLVLYITNYRNINKKHIFSLIVIILLTVAMFAYNENLLLRFNSLVNGESSHRYEIWQQAFSLIKQKIFFGYGLMTYSTIGLKGISGVHNAVIEILLFLGIFGFIAYANLLWCIFKKIVSNKNTLQIALFFSFLTITQFDQSIIKGIVSLSPLTLFAFFIFAYTKEKITIEGSSVNALQ